MRTVLPGDLRNAHRQPIQSTEPVKKQESVRWYSRAYLAKVFARRPAQLLAFLAFLVIAGVLLYVFASGSETASLALCGSGGGTLNNAVCSSSGTVSLSTASSGGGGTLIFDGTFGATSPGANWPSDFGGCTKAIDAHQVQFNITSSCNPGNDGHYRTDLCSSSSCDHNKATGDFYVSGQTNCTSIPIKAVSVGSIPSSGWLQFAEAKDWEGVGAGWEFDFFTNNGKNYVQFGMYDYGGNGAWGLPYTDSVATDSNWHTWSLCTNNANNNTGVVQGLWKDGVRQTFNHGAQSGSQSLSGFPIIDDGASNWPLDINDYTGGAPVPNTIIHGDPLIATMGSNGLPPEQPGGWNSP